MNAPSVTIIELRFADEEARGYLFEVYDILETIGERILGWQWRITDLDAYGFGEAFPPRNILGTAEQVTRLCQESATSDGTWLSGYTLLQGTRGVMQTIEGSFYAYPATTNPEQLSAHDKDTRYFLTNAMELSILVRDGFYYDIITKDAGVIANLLTQFPTARLGDATNFGI